MSEFLFSQAQELCNDYGRIVDITHSFPGNNPDPDISEPNAVIFVLHDGDPKFIFPPAVEKIIGPMRWHVERCMKIDRDTGTDALGRQVLSKLQRSICVRVMPPRFMVDANREEGVGVPLQYDTNVTEECEAHIALQNLHRAMTGAVNALQENMSAKAGIEIHSLAPNTPIVAPVTPSLSSRIGYQQYADAWNNAGSRRTSQIFYSYMEDGKMEPIGPGSITFARHLKRSVRGMLPVSFTEPYTLVSGTHRTPRVQRRYEHGIAFDISKEHLANYERGSHLLEDLVPDRKKIDPIAKGIANAILSTINIE